MLVRIAVHRPKPDKVAEMIATMHCMRDVGRDQQGLQRIHALYDAEAGVLVGLAIWDSEEDWLAAAPAMRATIADVDFTRLEDNPPDVFELREV
jgi:hypothetical protein